MTRDLTPKQALTMCIRRSWLWGAASVVWLLGAFAGVCGMVTRWYAGSVSGTVGYFLLTGLFGFLWLVSVLVAGSYEDEGRKIRNEYGLDGEDFPF